MQTDAAYDKRSSADCLSDSSTAVPNQATGAHVMQTSSHCHAAASHTSKTALGTQGNDSSRHSVSTEHCKDDSAENGNADAEDSPQPFATDKAADQKADTAAAHEKEVVEADGDEELTESDSDDDSGSDSDTISDDNDYQDGDAAIISSTSPSPETAAGLDINSSISSSIDASVNPSRDAAVPIPAADHSGNPASTGEVLAVPRLLLGDAVLPNHADRPAGDPINMTTGMGEHSAILGSSFGDALVLTAAVSVPSAASPEVPIAAASSAQLLALSGDVSVPSAAAQTVGDAVVLGKTANMECTGDLGNSRASDSIDSTVSDGTDTTASEGTDSTAGGTCSDPSGMGAVPIGAALTGMISRATAAHLEVPCITSDCGYAILPNTPAGVASVPSQPAGTIRVLIAPAAGTPGAAAALLANPCLTASAPSDTGPAPSSLPQHGTVVTAGADSTGPSQSDSREGEEECEPDQEEEVEEQSHIESREEEEEENEKSDGRADSEEEETESDESEGEEQDPSDDEQEVTVADLQHQVQEQQNLITRYTHDPRASCCVATPQAVQIHTYIESRRIPMQTTLCCSECLRNSSFS